MRVNFYEGDTCPNCYLSEAFNYFKFSEAKKRKSKYVDKFELKSEENSYSLLQSTCCKSDWLLDKETQLCFLLTPRRQQSLKDWESNPNHLNFSQIIDDLKTYSDLTVYEYGQHYVAGVELTSGEQLYVKVELTTNPFSLLDEPDREILYPNSIQKVFFDSRIIPDPIRKKLYSRPEMGMGSYAPLYLKSKMDQKIIRIAANTNVVEANQINDWSQFEIVDANQTEQNITPIRSTACKLLRLKKPSYSKIF